MIIHTIVPEELIYGTEQSYKIPQYLSMEGVEMLVDRLPTGDMQIVRIISTNPNDYLKYTPGQILGATCKG